MKKLLLVLAIVLFANVAKAEGFGTHIGFKLGYQTTKLSVSKADIKSGFSDHFTLGLFGRVVVKDFIIQPELLWFRSSQVFTLDNNGIINPEITMTEQNLAVPIFLGYQFIDKAIFKLRANVGPVMYFVVDQTNKCNVDNQSLDVEANNLTWGGAINVGIDLLMFTFDINYSFGLTNLFDSDNVTIGGESFKFDSSKQNVFTVTLGIKLFSFGI